MDLGSDTIAGASLVHSDELRALEQSFQDSFQPCNCGVTTLECRFHLASLRAAGSDSGSDLSVVVGESLEDIIAAQSSLLSLLWETLTVADRLSLLQTSWYIRTSVERIAGLSDYLRMARAQEPQPRTVFSSTMHWLGGRFPLSMSSDMLRSRASSRPQDPDDS